MNVASLKRTTLATFLVAGTCVGGGILALPVETGGMGLFPALCVLFVSWMFMMMTGLLFAEASLWMKEEGAHLVTISKHILGRFGEVITVILYLFMGYASLIAYNSGGSVLIVNFINTITGYGMPRWEACIIFGLVFGSTFYLGAKILGWINTVVVLGMIAAYFGMVSVGLGGIKTAFYDQFDWHGMYVVLPLMITSFSYQMIVPSLALYVEHDEKALRRSIVYGTTIPAVAYALWLVVVLGIVPNEGRHGLAESLSEGIAATESLKYFTHSTLLSKFAEFFAFFAIITSYFGIGLGLFDFLADLTKVKKKGAGKALLGLLVFLPTLYFTVLFPNAFVVALDITGGLGDSLLNGVIPVLIVWIGRYVIGYKGYRFGGGRLSLVGLLVFSLVIFGAQILKFIF